jgi:hypothetical protein
MIFGGDGSDRQFAIYTILVDLDVPSSRGIKIAHVVVDGPEKCRCCDSALWRRSLLDSHIFPGRQLLEDVTCYRRVLDNELIRSTPMSADGVISAHGEDILIHIISVKFTSSRANHDDSGERCGRPTVVRKDRSYVPLVR